MAEFAKSLGETKEALYALGPRAVEVLKHALDNPGGVASAQLKVAGEILDRMGLERKGNVPGATG